MKKSIALCLKRSALLTMAGCLLLFASAFAESGTTVRIAGGFFDEYWREKGIDVQTPDYHWKTCLALLKLDNAPDLYHASLENCDFQSLKNAGVLADLSGSERLMEAVSRMRPELQELVLDKEGRLVAMPLLMMSDPVYWRQEAFDAAGLTTADVPQSYTQLLDFAEDWAARVQARPESRVCFTDTGSFGGNASYAYTWWLTDMLVNAWEMQAYEAGQPLTFDTPEFVALLERTRKAGKLLYQAEPSQKQRQGMLSLFWNQHGGSGLEGLYNGGRDYGLSHTVPFRISDAQPALMRTHVSVNLVRADSPQTDAIIGYLERYVPSPDSVYSAELYRDGIAPGAYGKDFVERITAGWLKDRDEYAGTFSFAPRKAFFLYENALMKFFQGELSAEKLAQKISQPKEDPNR